MNLPLREGRLEMVRYLSPSVNAYEFTLMDGRPLSAPGPGSHVDLHLPDGRVRQYSLTEMRDDACVLAIQRGQDRTGAAWYLHEKAKIGDRFQIGAPRNHFTLGTSGTHAVFIAGGIGITPILPMLASLEARSASWELHYASAEERHAFDVMLARYGSKVRFLKGRAPGPRQLDIDALVRQAAPGTTFYCCGPPGMLEAFKLATADLPEGQVRTESFQAVTPLALDGGFVVVLERRNKQIVVTPGRTILECLSDAGVEVPNSCRQGICGACETTVISGRPDHRDGILSASERASGKTMMICCSGSLDDRLVLDV